jgi:hypothetical protein
MLAEIFHKSSWVVEKVWISGSVIDKKIKKSFLTEEKLDNIGAQMEMSPWKSWQFAVGCGVPELSAHRATRLFKIL